MPYFDATPATNTLLVSAGSKTYLLGSQAPAGGKMQVSSVAIAANVATVAVASISGPYPVVGTPITILGSQSGAGEFNVTNAVVTAVSFNPAGVGTVSFALTGANLAATPDIGTLLFAPPVTGELAVNNSFTMAGALARPSGARGQDAIFMQMVLPAPGVTALTGTVQVSSDYINWTSTAFTLSIVGGAIGNGFAYFETTALYVRLALTGLTGSGPIAVLVNI
jgi:hypothetical protein